MKKVSVIIPVYNTKKYLKKCLESICSQTYENLEILCIDDGSTDGSEDIVDAYVQKDKRVKAVHKENGGESSARNAGLKICTGDYIAFCDCDDWIEPDMYEVLVQVMEAYDLDMAACGWYRDTERKSEEIKNEKPVDAHVIGKEKLMRYVYMRDSYRGFAYMWDKLYKRELLEGSDGINLWFDENLYLGGDVLFLAEALLRVHRAKYVDRAFYHYNQRMESGCHTRNIERRREWLKAYEIIISRFEEENIDTVTLNYVKRFLAYHSSNAAEIAYEQNEVEALSEFQRFMKRYEQEYKELNRQDPIRIARYDKILMYK